MVRVHPAVPAISAFTEPLALPGTRDSDGWGTRGGHKMPPLFGLSEGACVESRVSTAPIWIQYLQALSTPAIALLAIVIGILQWRTAHQRAVLDLFDKRIEAYDSLNAAIAEIMREENATGHAIISFDVAAAKAPFLFGRDVTLFLQQPRKRIIQLRYAEVATNTEDDEKRGRAADLAAKNLTDLTNFYEEFATWCDHT